MKSSEIKIFSFILVIAVVLVGFAVAPVLLQKKRASEMNIPIAKPTLNRQLLVTPGAHVRGSAKAPITIVEFSDFQCPSCHDGAPVVEDLILNKKKNEVNLVFHHFQVKPQHIYSEVLSCAAEAAAEQGKFWEMHDVLFNKQKDLIASSSQEQIQVQIREIAKALGLDMMLFDTYMVKKSGAAIFAEDNKLGVSLGLAGTPTYFVIDPAGKVVQYNTTTALQDWAAGKPPVSKK